MIYASIAGYTVGMAESIPERYGSHATLVEEFDLDHADWSTFYLAVWRASEWPFLCVAQRYWPDHWAGCQPGVLLVPETGVLFMGAGERLLAYDLNGPARLWQDRADMGFHGWQRHDAMIVMAAELELAVWDIQGLKWWSTVVEPPWEYHVEGNVVQLDVMETLSSFPLLTGPTRS